MAKSQRRLAAAVRVLHKGREYQLLSWELQSRNGHKLVDNYVHFTSIDVAVAKLLPLHRYISRKERFNARRNPPEVEIAVLKPLSRNSHAVLAEALEAEAASQAEQILSSVAV